MYFCCHSCGLVQSQKKTSVSASVVTKKSRKIHCTIGFLIVYNASWRNLLTLWRWSCWRDMLALNFLLHLLFVKAHVDADISFCTIGYRYFLIYIWPIGEHRHSLWSLYVCMYVYIKFIWRSYHAVGDFKVGFSVGVYCTKCTLNTGVNTNFEITQCARSRAL
jgi:hypothetical protein